MFKVRQTTSANRKFPSHCHYLFNLRSVNVTRHTYYNMYDHHQHSKTPYFLIQCIYVLPSEQTTITALAIRHSNSYAIHPPHFFMHYLFPYENISIKSLLDFYVSHQVDDVCVKS